MSRQRRALLALGVLAAVAIVIGVTLLGLARNGVHVSSPAAAPTGIPAPTIAPAPVVPATVVPTPVSQAQTAGVFRLGEETAIAATGEAIPVAEYLAGVLRDWTELPLPLATMSSSSSSLSSPTSPSSPPLGDIVLAIEPGHPDGGYQLTVTPDGIRIAATAAAGLFWGSQTLRQLLPASGRATGPGRSAIRWDIAATSIEDHPRFAYRGAMLDVARHFFGVDEVKRYIDDIAMLKLNVLHLHLTDDQGWRIQINGWPRLTEHGGSTQVGGGGGGYYTQDDYRELVAYAASRFITIVPEIDMPGHTNAALASYPELNCDGKARALYKGTEVGFSSLCINSERTYQFVDDVVGQLAELTPGPWIHIGGDESLATSDADFLTFARRASAIVTAHGKTVIGWHELGRSQDLPSGTIGEYWSYTTPKPGAAASAQTFVDGGGALIMAPADVAYLDMKYDASSRLGLLWANGPTSVPEAYEWDPATILPGVGDDAILGVEAPLWTETIVTMDDLEQMAFPRIAAIAEVAWSPRRNAGGSSSGGASGSGGAGGTSGTSDSDRSGGSRDFADFAKRLARLGTMMDALGINYYRAPEIPWPTVAPQQ